MGEKISWGNASFNLSDIYENREENEGCAALLDSLEETALSEARNMVEQGKITFSENVLEVETFDGESAEFKGALVYHIGQSSVEDLEMNMGEDFVMFILSEDADKVIACTMLFVIDKLGDLNKSMDKIQRSVTVSIILPKELETVFTKKVFMKTKLLCSMIYPWVDFNSVVS